MSFDKIKAMRSAERFLTQGKITDAIKEYKLLVENDPKDFNTMNMLGDLFVKIDDKNQAVTYFTKVAEHYSKQGFAQKAIAVYNKVARLIPDSTDVSAKLAPLYHLKGSIADAKNHYTIVAERYLNQGKKIEALNIWKRIAELDPNNTDIYLKLGEGYWGENQKEEAAVSFIEAGTRLAGVRRYEKAVSAFSRAIEIKPTDFVALNGYVSSQIAIGRADDACELLLKIKKENPNNTEILALLTDCYIGLGNPSKAEEVTINLVEKEPSNYSKFLDVVSSYLKDNNVESAIRVLTMASEHLLVGGKADEYKSVTEEVLARNPEQLDALRLLVRFHGWMRDEGELKKALERMADSAFVNGVIEDEKYALTQLVAIPPFEPRYAERLEQLGGADKLEKQSLESQGFSATVVENEVPQFETFAKFETFEPQNTESILLKPETENHYFAIVSNAETVKDSNLNEIENNEVSDEPKLSPSLEMHLHQELESVDFYITNNYNDLALETLKSLETQFGKHPEIQKRKVSVGIITPEFLDSAKPNDEPSEVVAEQTDVETNEVLVGILQSENESHDLENFDQNNQSEHVTAEPEPKIAPEAEIIEANVVQETFDESKSETIESLTKDSQTSDTKTESENQFQDFTSELGFEDADQESGNDFETHFNFGIAYKEMGLLDQSAGEFQEAVKLVKPNDGTRRHFQCCNWLGHCFIEKQMANLALIWFEKCFETPDLNPEEKRALFYEFAVANELEGEADNAIKYFEQIYSEDVGYRDVGEKLKKLRS